MDSPHNQNNQTGSPAITAAADSPASLSSGTPSVAATAAAGLSSAGNSLVQSVQSLLAPRPSILAFTSSLFNSNNNVTAAAALSTASPEQTSPAPSSPPSLPDGSSSQPSPLPPMALSPSSQSTTAPSSSASRPVDLTVLMEQLSEVSQKFADSQMASAELRSDNAALTQENNKLKSQLDSYKWKVQFENLDRLNKENQEVKQRLEEKEREKVQWNSLCTALQERVGILEMELRDEKEEKQSINQQLQQQTEEYQKKYNECESVQSAVERVTVELEAERTAFQSFRAAAEEENKSIIERHANEVAALQTQWENDRRELEHSISELTSARNRLQSLVNSLRIDYGKLWKIAHSTVILEENQRLKEEISRKSQSLENAFKALELALSTEKRLEKEEMDWISSGGPGSSGLGAQSGTGTPTILYPNGLQSATNATVFSLMNGYFIPPTQTPDSIALKSQFQRLKQSFQWAKQELNMEKREKQEIFQRLQELEQRFGLTHQPFSFELAEVDNGDGEKRQYHVKMQEGKQTEQETSANPAAAGARANRSPARRESRLLSAIPLGRNHKSGTQKAAPGDADQSAGALVHPLSGLLNALPKPQDYWKLGENIGNLSYTAVSAASQAPVKAIKGLSNAVGSIGSGLGLTGWWGGGSVTEAAPVQQQTSKQPMTAAQYSSIPISIQSEANPEQKSASILPPSSSFQSPIATIPESVGSDAAEEGLEEDEEVNAMLAEFEASRRHKREQEESESDSVSVSGLESGVKSELDGAGSSRGTSLTSSPTIGPLPNAEVEAVDAGEEELP